jgi:hypothetical protein
MIPSTLNEHKILLYSSYISLDIDISEDHQTCTHRRLPNPVLKVPLTALSTPSSHKTGQPIIVEKAKKYSNCGKWSVAMCIS